VIQPLTLCHPNWDLDFVLRVDSSQKGVGAALYNVDESGEYFPISFFSKRIPKRLSKKFSSTLECYGIKESIKHYSHYLRGRRFKVETDNKPLLRLNKGQFGNSMILS